VLLAIEDWADAHGGVPPTCTDWRNLATDGFPGPAIVIRLFGTWNAAILEAGYELKRDTRPETHEAIMAALRAGESFETVAERYGVSPQAIRNRLKWRDLTLDDVRRAAA
jgi:hypothetical protein